MTMSIAEHTTDQSEHSLDQALDRYARDLAFVERSATEVPAELLQALMDRDRIAVLVSDTQAATPATIQRLVKLDQRLRFWVCNSRSAGRAAIREQQIASWRDVMFLNAEKIGWWWRPEAYSGETAILAKTIHYALAGTLMAITVSVMLDIITRLWGGGLDISTALVGVLTVTLTGSPLIRQGREVMQWLLQRVGWRSPEMSGIALAMALPVCIAVLLIRFVGLPLIAHVMNERGAVALGAGRLTEARAAFDRATAISSDYAVAYYNLAMMYEQSGDYQTARTLNSRALSYNMELDVAYNNLGRIDIIEESYEQAIHLLRIGLVYASDPTARAILLTNLGHAYLLTNRAAEAVSLLNESSKLDASAAANYYYVAQAYERLGQPTEAAGAWQLCFQRASYAVHQQQPAYERAQQEEWAFECHSRMEAKGRQP